MRKLKKLITFSFVLLLFLNNFLLFNSAKANDNYVPFEKKFEDNTEEIVFRDLNLHAAVLDYYKFHIDKNYDGNTLTRQMLESLTTLNLSWANIFSLEGLEYAVNLKNLNLGNNFIEDVTPISNIEGLEDLNLNNNKIKDVKSLSNLKKLKKLALKKNLISNIDFLNDINVEELDLSKNGILKNEIKNKLKLSNLRILIINNLGLYDIDFLENASNLEVLSAEGNNIKYLTPLKNLVKLRHLNLDKNYIEDISELSNLLELTELNLVKNDITDLSVLENKKNLNRITLDENRRLVNIEHLSKIDGLSIISLNNTSVKNIEPLYNLKNIFYVSLVGAKVSKEEITKFKKYNENLKISNNSSTRLEVITNNSEKYFSLKNYFFMLIITLFLISGIISYWKKN